VSALLTVTNALSSDKDSDSFYARTDTRLEVVSQTDWFIFPYPGMMYTMFNSKKRHVS